MKITFFDSYKMKTELEEIFGHEQGSCPRPSENGVKALIHAADNCYNYIFHTSFFDLDDHKNYRDTCLFFLDVFNLHWGPKVSLHY